MLNEFYRKINELNIPNNIKELLLSNILDSVYIEYKHLEEVISGLDIDLQNEILSIIINYNKKLYDKEKQIQTELKTIQKIKENKINNSDVKSDIISVRQNSSHKQTSTIVLDIKKYLQDINEIKSIDELEFILPNAKLEKYQDYINLILLSLYKDFKDINDMLYDDLEDDVRKDFIEELNLIKEKINYIKDYHQEQLFQINEDEEIENTNIKNKIIYLTTESGMPYALKDLKTIDSEQYKSFYYLFNSIINGTFKNNKNFNNEHSNTFVSEVRGCNTRIVYDRVGPDTYIILRFLIKKINNDTYYQTSIADRCIPYKKQKDVFRTLISDPEYINECDQVTEEILNILKPRSRKGD